MIREINGVGPRIVYSPDGANVTALQAVAEPTVSTAKKTILLVDDEVAIRSLCGMILQGEGYNVLVAPNASKALAILETSSVDLMLTDYMMPPGIDGLELTKEVNKLYPNTKVILMSALKTLDLDGLKLAGQFSKPFESSDLIECIGKLFGAEEKLDEEPVS